MRGFRIKKKGTCSTRDVLSLKLFNMLCDN